MNTASLVKQTEVDTYTLLNLLREALPYLTKVEMGSSTSTVLRALIKDIEYEINHAGRS